MSTIRGIVVAEPDLVLSSAATPIGPIPGRVTEAEGQSSALAPVSYTHLTLPTNREV